MNGYMNQDRHSEQYNWLVESKSPYLLQHKTNPVNWLEWSPEAFEKAKRENKPVFLSIGYSTCHWCHVMAHESFEDAETAAILNEHYIAIKVDREERPDIDAIYMRVCQALTGHGGWPLSVFLTPDQKPFYAGMYFPKTRQYNQPSFSDVLLSLNEQYHKDPEKIISIGSKIVASLSAESVSDMPVMPTIFKQAAERFTRSFDKIYGGFGQAPKFPSPHQLLFLLNVHHFKDDDEALEMVMTTLDGMIAGGIHDHIGGGFCRYSVDEKWLIPHFEKMLYDQAMLMLAFTEAYKVTQRTSYKEAVYGIYHYLERTMVSNEGMYFAAEDADSEGEEGKYYLFDANELERVLGVDEAELFCEAYNVKGAPVLNGKFIPNQIGTSEWELAEQFGISVQDLKSRLTNAKEKLRHYREKRVHLHTDDKLLTGWNALMIQALAEASIVFEEPVFLKSARRTLTGIESLMMKDLLLYARHRDGETKYIGYLDDYSALIAAYESLYKATFDFAYLEKMKKWTDLLIDGFWDRENGGFFLSHKQGERLIFNPKDAYDGALPSGNSVALSLLIKMTHYTGELSYKEKADKLIEYFSEDINRDPLAFTGILTALMQEQAGIQELAVLSSEAFSYETLQSLQQTFQPNLILVVLNEELIRLSLNPLWNNFKLINGETAYYLCENHACQQSVTDLSIIKEKLGM